MSLVNLDFISEPATKLIEKVSDAVGGMAKPWQMKRVAKAEAEAEIIRAEANIQISDIERRAMERLVREEGKKQENIENITMKAIPNLSDTAKPENLDNDWVAMFFDKSRLVSDEKMQEIWAKLLAGEANNQGTFSKKTIELVSSLDKKDAELFTALCSFCVLGGPYIMDYHDEVYTKRGINFHTINHLQHLGLVATQSLGYVRKNMSKNILFVYCGEEYLICDLKLEEESNSINAGKVSFTTAGEQLAKLVQAEPVPGFLEYFLEKIRAEHPSASLTKW
jgi:hypothetical protein